MKKKARQDLSHLLCSFVSVVYRIDLQSQHTAVRWKELHVRLVYAMTINKSQKQTLQMVGISLAKDVFSHGQWCVAFSRATARQNVSVLIETNSATRRLMHNIVYSEALW